LASETAFHSAHVEQVHEEVVGQRLRPLGKDAVLGLSEVGLQYAHAADENGYLGRGQRQQVGPSSSRVSGDKFSPFRR
jgi:hypothetical protein